MFGYFPNITGYLFYAGGSSLSTSGAFYSGSGQFGYYHGSTGTAYLHANFDASRASSLYSSIEAVQPASAQAFIIIKA